MCIVDTDWVSLGGWIRRAQITYLWELQDSRGFPAPELPPPNFAYPVHTVGPLLTRVQSTLLAGWS